MTSQKSTKSNKSQLEPTGNTNTVGSTLPKKKQESQLYRWCFTLKAIDAEGEPIEPEVVAVSLKAFCKEFYFQLEKGVDGYLHYQGCFSLKVKERRDTCKNIIGHNSVHLEPCRNWYRAKKYCSKEESRVKGPWDHHTNWIQTITNLRPWQREISEFTLLSEPNDRSIIWIWDTIGNKGKSAISKYLAIVHGATILNNGSFADLAYALPDNPKIIIFDLPRTIEGRVNYTAIEKCKDGAIFSAKYESRMKWFNPPHVIVFANFEPDYTRMSMDRWVVIDLDKTYYNNHYNLCKKAYTPTG